MTDSEKLEAIRRLLNPRAMPYKELIATIAHIIEHGTEPILESCLENNPVGIRLHRKYGRKNDE